MAQESKKNVFVASEPNIAQALYQCVAETVVTTMMAQNFHWNVTGMAFGPLHALFQEIYEDHFTAQDDLAERIRSLGLTVDGRLHSMINSSKVIEEETNSTKTDLEMIASLLEAQRTVAATLSGASDIAASNGDKLTEDLCVERGRVHEKFAWLLGAHLGR
jgi:starvation-inducible DNA-binding protein